MANPYEVVIDGVTTEYTVSFTLVNTNDLKVDIDGVLVDPGDYSVDGYGLNDSSFRVTFTDAPTPVNSTLTIRRVATVERVTNFSQSSNWTSTALNAEFDNLINIINDVDATTLSLDVLAAYWDADSKQIKNLADGTDGTDAINLSQLNAADNVNSITQPVIGDLDEVLTVTGAGTYDWAAIPIPTTGRIITRTMTNSGSGSGGNTYTQVGNLTTLTTNPLDVTLTGTATTSEGFFKSDVTAWTSGTDLTGAAEGGSLVVDPAVYIPLGIASAAGSNCIATIRNTGNYVGLNMYSNAQGSQTTTVHFLKIT